MDFFCFSTFIFFFHFLAFGLRPSGLGFKAFFFFELQLVFPFYCLRFKAVGFFRLAASFSILLPSI